MRRVKRHLLALHVTTGDWIEETVKYVQQSALWAETVVVALADDSLGPPAVWPDSEMGRDPWRIQVYQPWGSTRFRENTNHMVNDMAMRLDGVSIVRLEAFQTLSHPDRIRDCVEFNPNSILTTMRYYMADDDTYWYEPGYQPLRVPVAMPLRREETWNNGLSAMPAAAYETAWPHAQATFDLLDYSKHGIYHQTALTRPYQRTP